MPPTSTAASRPSKAERTRAAILSEAERLFARHGFAATRLEDVAHAVGVKRAAIFYHFRDKQALYDAMIEDAFAELVARLEAALAPPGPIAARIEAAVEAWVDVVTERPALARLILRHAADAEERAVDSLFPAAERLLRQGWRLFDEGRRTGELDPLHESPFHTASALLGATVFYVAALRPLLLLDGFDPLAPDQVAAHKRDALRAARRLLGFATLRPVRGNNR